MLLSASEGGVHWYNLFGKHSDIYPLRTLEVFIFFDFLLPCEGIYVKDINSDANKDSNIRHVF